MKRIYYLLAFIAGVFISGYFSLWQGILAAVLLCIPCLHFSWKKFVALGLLFVLGAGYQGLWQAYVNYEEKQLHQNMTSLVLQVVSQPEETENGNRKLICKVKGKPFKIQVYVLDKSADIKYLDTVKVESFTYYYSLQDSYGEHLKSENIYGNITVRAEQLELLQRVSDKHPLVRLSALREGMLRSLKSHFAGDTYPLLAGILMGEKEAQTEDFRQMLSVTGVSHVVVVSGMHFAIFMLMLAGILKWLMLSVKVRSLLLMGATVFLAIFMGATPSVLRVSFMLILTYLCDYYFLDRRDTVSVVILSAFCIVLLQPYAVTGISFLLSYGAVLGILLFEPKISSWFTFLWKPIRSVVSASLAAQISVFPFLVYYFHSFSLVFLLGNLAICLLLPYLMGYGLFYLAVSALFPFAASFLAYPLEQVLSAVLWVLTGIQRLPFAFVSVQGVGKLSILFYFVFLTCLLCCRGWKKLLPSAGMLLLFCSFFLSLSNLIWNGADIHCLAAPDNTVYLLTSGNRQTILLDLASDWERSEYDTERIADAVRLYGGGKVDYYIAGGPAQVETYESLCRLLPVGEVYAPHHLAEDAIWRVHPFQEDTTLRMGGFSLSLHCQRKDGRLTAVTAVYEDNTLLFTTRLNEKGFAPLREKSYDLVAMNRYVSSVQQKVYGTVDSWSADSVIYNLNEKITISDCYNIDFCDRISIKLFPSKHYVIK